MERIESSTLKCQDVVQEALLGCYTESCSHFPPDLQPLGASGVSGTGEGNGERERITLIDASCMMGGSSEGGRGMLTTRRTLKTRRARASD